MVREITKDIFFLGQKSEPATEADIQIGRDLQDTLKVHRAECVGMAANMIGIKKNIIIVNMGIVDLVMFNPVLLKKSGPYETEEGCLSLTGVRKTTRYREIEVEYRDMSWTVRRQKLSGWTAQICQHEMDHLNGIIIYISYNFSSSAASFIINAYINAFKKSVIFFCNKLYKVTAFFSDCVSPKHFLFFIIIKPCAV